MERNTIFLNFLIVLIFLFLRNLFAFKNVLPIAKKLNFASQ